MSDIDEDKIRDIISKVQAATIVALSRTAEQMATLAARETVNMLNKLGYQISVNEATNIVKRVVSKRMETYIGQLGRGGSECVDRILTSLGDGRYRATTAVRFVDWLYDKEIREADEILTIIRRETDAHTHPFKIARMLDEYFEGTFHNSETVARTEAAKIRSDVRFDVMKDQGVHYLQYLTAGDDRVRKEHRMRNGKIYPIDKAPWLGEYNCRCVLIPADREVRNGAPVTESDAEVISL